MNTPTGTEMAPVTPAWMRAVSYTHLDVYKRQLQGVFDGDLAVALDRAAAFCRVVSAGRASTSEGEVAAARAADLLGTAEDLSAAAGAWRRDQLA